MPDNRPSKQKFTEWLRHEMPAGTVIGDPDWWAHRIWAATIVCLPEEPQEATESQRANDYALRLLESLVARFGTPAFWEPLPDLVGRLTQIDNVVTGLLARIPHEPLRLPQPRSIHCGPVEVVDDGGPFECSARFMTFDDAKAVYDFLGAALTKGETP